MIYFIECLGFTKIGYTTDPLTRIPAIQQGLPERVQVLCIIEGDRALEKKLHETFAINRSRMGEWFYNNETLTKFIEEQDNIAWRFGFGPGALDVDPNVDPVGAHRRRMGLTMQNLGDRLGITRQGVSNLERGAKEGSIKLSTLRNIAEVTGHKLEIRYVPLDEEIE